jgi:anti-anti-sigma factor
LQLDANTALDFPSQTAGKFYHEGHEEHEAGGGRLQPQVQIIARWLQSPLILFAITFWAGSLSVFWEIIMPNAADLVVQRIENTEADLVRFGGSELVSSVDVMKIQEQLLELIKSGKTTLILGLSDVATISSEMMGVMVEVNKAAKRNGGRVHLLAPTFNVLKALEISKLYKLMPIHSTLDAVVAEING